MPGRQALMVGINAARQEMRKCRQRARSSAGAIFNRLTRPHSPFGVPPPIPMAVIPITLSISLALVVAFVVFFLREHKRDRRGGAERDSLMPLAEETRRPVPPRDPAAGAGPRRG